MSDTESRGRDRVPAELSGVAELLDTGEHFRFETMDFSVAGMLFRAEGLAPAVGQKVRLNFILPTDDDHVTPVMLSAEVVRIVEKEDGPLYGVRWLDQENAQNIELLEHFYTERFFDMIE